MYGFAALHFVRLIMTIWDIWIFSVHLKLITHFIAKRLSQFNLN